MTVKIKPSVLEGEVNAPPSKSMAHRLLICAGLSEGESVIDGVAYSEDILATLDCLSSMGCGIKKEETRVIIEGISPFLKEEKTFPCRESGSTLRFFLPLAFLGSAEQTFTGYGRLMERPMKIYEEIAREKGLFFEQNSSEIKVKGPLKGGKFSASGGVSSQFISGLLFALPLCFEESEIELIPPLESVDYINMTIDAMKTFGVKIEWKNERTLFVKGSQRYKKKNLKVEGDWSNGAFLEAFNLFGSKVQVKGLSENSLQGDKIYRTYFKLLNEGAPVLDIKNCPDLGPILITVAALKNGARLKGTRRLKIKESDRAEAMKEELSKFGAEIEVFEDEILIKKAELHEPKAVLSSHNDHRVAMSLSVIASVFGGEIEGAESTKKSYPDFFSVAKSLGLEAEKDDN